MTVFLQLYLNQFLVFVLVLSRISGLVVAAPIFGSRSVPIRIRALMAVAFSVLIAPIHFGTEVEHPGNVLNFLILVGQELVVGLTLAVGITILLMGLQVAGTIVSQMSALSLAEVVDPSFDSSISVFSQLFDVIALSVFLIIGGHRHVMSALLDTFSWMPPGSGNFGTGVVQTMTGVLGQSFVLGIRAAAPAVVALLMSILVMGLISRTLPQLNILAIGFSVNTIVLMGTLALSLGSVVWIFQQEVGPTVEAVLDVFRRRPFD